MAAKLKTWMSWLRDGIPGTVLTALVYAAMLILVLIFFTGNGQFLYEL